MITRTYDDTYSDSAAGRAPVTYVGEQIFLWIAWVAVFGFWAFSMQTAFGIMDAIFTTPATVMGGVDLGGIEFAIFSGLGVVVVALAIAYGAARWATRDRSLDPVTEAATAKLYDEGARPRA
jgi:hypothetical protein